MTLVRSLALPVLALVALALGAPAGETDGTRADPILLTVTGAVGNPNRGAYDEDADKFFGFNAVDFEAAAEFDFAALASLPQQRIETDFPRGRALHVFEGPLLADLLDAVAAQGETITIQALDGYAITLERAELEEAGAVVALRRDGHALSIGGFGPTHIVFPRTEDGPLAEMPDDWWVWSVFHINVE